MPIKYEGFHPEEPDHTNPPEDDATEASVPSSRLQKLIEALARDDREPSTPVHPSEGFGRRLLRAHADDTPAFNPNNKFGEKTQAGHNELFNRLGPPDAAQASKIIESVLDLLGPPPEPDTLDEADRQTALYKRAYERLQATPESDRTEPGWSVLKKLASKYDAPTTEEQPKRTSRFRRYFPGNSPE
jgi:hypothetical protein